MILASIGFILLIAGVICDVFGAIGMHRFDNFYLRLHAATVGTIGGKFYPLIGVTLIAADMRLWSIAGIALLSALLVMITAPVGSHALAFAAAEKNLVPIEKNEFTGDSR